jgi:hypothetical protein
VGKLVILTSLMAILALCCLFPWLDTERPIERSGALRKSSSRAHQVAIFSTNDVIVGEQHDKQRRRKSRCDMKTDGPQLHKPLAK